MVSKVDEHITFEAEFTGTNDDLQFIELCIWSRTGKGGSITDSQAVGYMVYDNVTEHYNLIYSFDKIGKYSVVARATDVDGNLIYSNNTISLTVYENDNAEHDSDNDGIADDQELLHFGDLYTADATSDIDGDGILDKDEIVNGTNPNVIGTNPTIFATSIRTGSTVHIYQPADQSSPQLIPFAINIANFEGCSVVLKDKSGNIIPSSDYLLTAHGLELMIDPYADYDGISNLYLDYTIEITDSSNNVSTFMTYFGVVITNESDLVVVPDPVGGRFVNQEQVDVSLASGTENATIKYSIDGGNTWQIYNSPIEIQNDKSVLLMYQATSSGGVEGR